MRGCRGENLEVKVQKHGAPSDSEYWQHLNKILRQASTVREWLQAIEERKCREQFNDEEGDEDSSPVKILRLTWSASCCESECDRSDGA